jgi:hypothetical protein
MVALGAIFGLTDGIFLPLCYVAVLFIFCFKIVVGTKKYETN